MVDAFTALVSWFAHLFNPPPLASMSPGKKIVRSFLVALTLFFCCVASAVLGAAGLYLAGKVLDPMRLPAVVNGAMIIIIAVVGDTLCLRTLLAIKRQS